MNSDMDITTIQSLIKEVFMSIENATSIEQVEALMDRSEIRKTLPEESKYPRIQFTITRDELKDMAFERLLQQPSEKDTIKERLFYALIWKNGDLMKLERLYEGIVSEAEAEPPGKAIVFYQFGKKLADEKEPIIDQHTLRAFDAWQLKDKTQSALQAVCKRSAYDKHDWKLALAYKNWLKGLPDELQTADGIYAIDQVLFALGKCIKMK